MSIPGLDVIVVETMTGKRLATLPRNGHTAEAVLNGPGTITTTIPWLTDAVGNPDELRGFLEPVRCSLAAVLTVGDVEIPIEAGPIWAVSADETDGTVQVKASGLWSLFNRRFLVDPTQDVRLQSSDLDFSGMALATIAKRLVQNSLSRVGGGLPLTLPPEYVGTAQRHYYSYELGVTGDRLKQLTQVLAGPDIDFQPVLQASGTAISWLMRTGTPDDPLLHQVGDDYQLDFSALDSLTADMDASNQSFVVWTTGSGQEREQMMGTARADDLLTSGQWPLVETSVAYSNVSVQDTLTQYAQAQLSQNRARWTTYTASAKYASPAAATLATVRPGDWVQVNNDLRKTFTPAQSFRSRVTSVRADLEGISVTLAPVVSAR